jgi:hypothetical protein
MGGLTRHGPQPCLTVGQYRNLRPRIHSQRFWPMADLALPCLYSFVSNASAAATPGGAFRLAAKVRNLWAHVESHSVVKVTVRL